MKARNIIFAGTPTFAAVIFEKLLTTSHNIVAVYTQPDRPAGRGQKLTASPVKALALQQHIPIFQPEHFRDVHVQQQFIAHRADLMVVVAYGLLLPKIILDAPRLGCINVHASLLPRWRGAAPIQRAILAGDAETGITIMQMNEGLDTGEMLYKVSTPITRDDTTTTLHDRLAVLGAEALITTLAQETLTPEKQQESQATYAKKIVKSEAQLDWNESAELLLRKIHAFNPWPVAFALLAGQAVRIWQAKILPKHQASSPGKILSATVDGIDVATATNTLRITALQLPGGRVLTAHDMLNAHAKLFAVGHVWQ